MNSQLISQYRELHKSNLKYGSRDGSSAAVIRVCRYFNFETVLDFGCGKGSTVEALRRKGIYAQGYDPAIEKYAHFPPERFDLVHTHDVLEHLEQHSLSEDLARIAASASGAILASISCRRAAHTLPNGQNCHTLIMKRRQWLKTLSMAWKDFEILESRYHYLNRHLNILLIKKEILLRRPLTRLHQPLLPAYGIREYLSFARKRFFAAVSG